MSKYLTEFDEIQAAFRQVRLDENCMVYRNGMLLENQDTYNKIQKLLNTSEMCEAHRYLYDLDVECLSEDEIQRVDKLFDLGVKKGYIDNSFEEELAKSENPDAIVADEEPEKAAEIETHVEEPRKVPIPCWTILYSATKNGETKCGECYSNAISVSAAKADCFAKLERFGYGNVSILAIEAGDSDCAKMADDDMIKGRVNNLDTIEEAKETDDSGDDVSDDTVNTDDAELDSDDSGDDSGDDSETNDSEDEDDGSEEGDDSDDDSEGDDAESDSDDSDDDAEKDDDSGDGDSEGEELSDEEKSTLKDEYKTTFRQVMLSCGFEDRSFIDLTISEKVKFFEKLASDWTKNDPKEFMSEEEQDQLESIVVTPQ